MLKDLFPKRKFYFFLLPFIGGAAIVLANFFSPPNYNELNFVHRFVATGIVGKWEKFNLLLPADERAILDYDSLINQLNFYEKDFVEKIFSINPKELGFKGPFYSKEKPTRLIKVENVILDLSKNIETGVQYCPPQSYQDYLRMMTAMKEQIGKQLYIDSGYRSPGRQAYLFIYYLVRDADYSLLENARWIALPGFSEHGNPINNAIDFVNEDGINGFSRGQTPEAFENLPEYKWLQENGNNFNFFLSYPKDNPHGVAFEPWHWHWDN